MTDIPRLNGREAIRLLRLLIPQTEHVHPGLSAHLTALKPDKTNMECGVHAMAAAFAFAVCGCKARIANGIALIFLSETNLVQNHYFVVREVDSAVFDSSIAPSAASPIKPHERFGGIDFSGCPDLPALTVLHRHKKPGMPEVEALVKAGGSSPTIMYVEDKAWLPEQMIEWKTSDTDFGRWVNQTFGTQFGMYTRFGWAIANALISGTSETISDRETLIELVKNTSPDVIHKVRTRCKKLAK